MKQNTITSHSHTLGKVCLTILFFFIIKTNINAQAKIPIIKASDEKAFIIDGENVKIDWKLSPQLKPDTYYVNIPSKKSKVTLKTDQDEMTFKTKPGKNYDVIVLLNENDSCYVRISSKHPPSSVSMYSASKFPKSVPFTLIGSRIYFKGNLNDKPLTIQLDLGAGTNVINKLTVDKMDLKFTETSLVSNTDGINEERKSINNKLTIGSIN